MIREKIATHGWYLLVICTLALSPFFNSLNSLLTVIMGVCCISLLPFQFKISRYFSFSLIIYGSLLLTSLARNLNDISFEENALFYIAWPICVGFAHLKSSPVNLSLISKWLSRALITGFLVLIIHGIYATVLSGNWRILDANGQAIGTWFTYTNLTWDGHPWYFGLAIGLALILELNNDQSSYLSVILLQLALVLAMGRINILGLLTVYSLSFIFLPLKRKIVFKYLISFIIILTAVFSLNKMLVNDRFNERLNSKTQVKPLVAGADTLSATMVVPNGAEIRKYEWSCAWSIIKENPWLGSGNVLSQKALHQCYQETGFTFGFVNKYNCHNQYLEFAIRHGLIWTFLAFFSFMALIVQLFKRKYWALSLSWIYILICLLTESGLIRQAGSNFIALWALISVAILIHGETRNLPQE